jgi:hypothetical protein
MRQLRTLAVAATIAALAGVSAAVAAQEEERFTAFAVSVGGPRTAPVAEPVTITISRWTTPAERSALVSALSEHGSDALLDELQDQPRVGHIRTPDALGYPLRYAAEEKLPDGGRRIVLATDRPIAFWETWYQTRTLDYPFSVIELRLDEEGDGQGKLALATKVLASNGHIVLENWSVAPVQLNNVQSDR